MADRYIKHTGSNTSPYNTWAKAATTRAAAVAGASAGDTLYESSSHSATGLPTTSLTFPGTASNPLKLICVDDGVEPPTAVSAGGAESFSANTTFSIGPFAFVEGIVVISGDETNTTGSINISSGSGPQAGFYKNCTFNLANTGSGSRIYLQTTNFSAASRVVFQDCVFGLGAQINQGISIGGRIAISGGYVVGPASYTTFGLFQTQSGGRNTFAEIENVDLSGVGAATNLVGSSSASMITRISNCKLPTSWAGNLFTGNRFPGQRVSLYNSDSEDTNYRLWIEDYSGSIKDDTAVVRTGGASDGITPISWRLATNADANELTVPLRTDTIAVWNSSVGTPVTVAIEVVTDGVALKNDECWIDVDYLGTSGVPLGASINNKRATVLTTPANQPPSSAAWTTTGLASPIKQKLSVTFTPRKAGALYVTVRLGKPSTTVYVDPKITVS